MRTSLVLMIASLMKTKLTGAFHLSELVGRISQSILKLNASVLSNRDLFVVKLTLFWKDNKFCHAHLFQFGKAHAFHLRTRRSGRTLLTNGKRS